MRSSKFLCLAVMPSPFYVDQIVRLHKDVEWHFYGNFGKRSSWGLSTYQLNCRNIIHVFAGIVSGRYEQININSYSSLKCILVALFAKSWDRSILLSLGIYEEIRMDSKITFKSVLREIIIKKIFRIIDIFYPCGNVSLASSKRYIMGPKHVKLLPYAFSKSRVKNSSADNRRRWSEKFCILFSGNASPVRNPYELVESLSLCDANVRENICLIVSSPYNDYLTSFKQWAEENFIDFEIIYDRKRESWNEILEIYSIADVLVVPNRYSSWNMTTQEALCFGLPVVGTYQTASVREFITDASNGFVYDSGDVNRLAAIITRLVTDKELFLNMKKFTDAKSSFYFCEDINLLYRGV